LVLQWIYMLYWICPECGQECSPAIRECPTCAAAEKAASQAAPRPETSATILAFAQTFQSAPAPGPGPVFSAGPPRKLVSVANGYSAPASATVITLDAADVDVAEAAVAEVAMAEEQAPPLAPATHAAIESLVQPSIPTNSEPLKPAVSPVPPRVATPALITLAEAAITEVAAELAVTKQEAPPLAGATHAAIESLLQPSIPTSSDPLKPAVSPVPPRAPAPALVDLKKTPPVEFRLKSPGLAPTGAITFQAALLRLPRAHEQSAEPAPSRRRSVAFVRVALPGVRSSGLAPADFAPPREMRLTPPQAGNQINAAPLDPNESSLAFISSKLELAGESLSEMLHAWERSAEELEQAAIRALHSSFQEQPTELLLCAPREIVTAPAPPAEQWMRTPRLVFTAKEPGNAGLATLAAGPQPPTLAGPCLPPQLQNFTASSGSRHRLLGKRAAAPTWMVTVLIIALFLGGSSLVQYLTANREAKAAPAAAAPTRTSDPASATALPAAEEHPGARFVEVAGVRVVTAPNRKPQLQYIVINHSAGELTGLNIHLALRSADSPSGAPLIRVSSIVPSLGANQSKEIRTDLDAGMNAASLPDWQSLRTEILIARQ
jgi:hypothetical protein